MAIAYVLSQNRNQLLIMRTESHRNLVVIQCLHCGHCLCPITKQELLIMTTGHRKLVYEQCLHCGHCLCPNHKTGTKLLRMTTGQWLVYTEHCGHCLCPITQTKAHKTTERAKSGWCIQCLHCGHCLCPITKQEPVAQNDH